jgi:hypothetical protein
MAAHDRWATCPSCGSSKVKSVSKIGFIPTAARAATGGPGGPASGAAFQTCGCGTALAPAWRYCPMCATPVAPAG